MPTPPPNGKIRISDTELVHAREKAMRASRHFEVATRVIRRWVRSDCGLESRRNRKTGEFDILARMPDPPPTLALLVGDCVHNLRTALDHIVYALAETNPARSPGSPLSDSLMFPICDTRARYEQQIRQGRLAGVPADAAKVIESLQPFQWREKGHDHTTSPLWVLNRLENIDKHRRLTLHAGVTELVHLSVAFPDGAGDTELVISNHTLHDGAILFSYPASAGGGHVRVHGQLHVVAAIQESVELPSLIDTDIAYVLRSLCDYVGNRLLPKFGRVSTGRKPRRPRRRREDARPKFA